MLFRLFFLSMQENYEFLSKVDESDADACPDESSDDLNFQKFNR